MYNKKIRKILKKPQPNSGFTLVELLAGLIMSIFVTGALGFGLYQIMSATSAEKAKANARSEASRAIEFISDELRRAENMEANSTNATGFNSSGKQVILALNVPELNSSQLVDIDGNGSFGRLGSDDNDSTTERIVYYLKSTGLGNWQGPQVLYRYGPPLSADGKYTENAWQEEALIDGIDNTPIANDPCETGETLNPPMASSPSGFYACINGTSTAAQIFLTGGIDANVIAGNDSNYTSETKAVARAKDVAVSSAVAAAVAPITFRSLEADYVCHTGNTPSPNDDEIWTMRTDFDNSKYASGASKAYDRNTNSSQGATMNDATKWVHEKDRKAQPIDIDSSNDLTIYSIPVESNDCSNPTTTNNEGISRTKNLGELVGNPAPYHTVSHTIKFQSDVTNRPGGNDTEYYKTFNGNTTGGYDNPNVTTDGRVQVFKNGSTIEKNAPISSLANAPARGYPGYDFDNDGTADRMSLGRFLYNKGYAKLTNPSEISEIDPNNPNDYKDPSSGYTIKDLEPNERIIAFEVGHTDNGTGTTDTDGDGEPSPGFDLQDNIFIMTHNAFAENH
jgi:type II secretory pathway pseudopilin PulG